MTLFPRRSRVTASFLAALGVFAFASDPLSAQRLDYFGSVQFSSGDYVFAARTSSVYFANGVSFTGGRWRGSVTVPIVAQDAGWVQYSGGVVIPTGGMHDGGASRSGDTRGGMMSTRDNAAHGAMGLGDPILRADFDLVQTGGGLSLLRITSAIKAPVASVETGFGTGAWDAGAGLSYSQLMGDMFLFGDATFWRLGDGPDYRLRDIVTYAVGVGRPLPGRRLAVLASMLGSTSFISGVPAPTQVGGGVSYRSASGRGLSVSSLVGLTRSAPDIAIAAGWQVPLR